MNTARRVRSFFDRIAGDYLDRRYGDSADAWRAYFFSGRLRQVEALLGDRPGRILDVGSGPGVPAGALARAFRVDLSPAMLARAGPRAFAGDAAKLPVRTGAVDTVVALGVTTYLDDPAAMLAEAARVLRPGGRLVVSFTRRAAPDTIFRAAWRATLGRLAHGRGVLAAGLRIRAWSDGEIGRALAAAGFRTLDRRVHNFTVFPFAYLFRRTSLALARRRERTPGTGWLGSDVVVLARRDAPPPAPRTRVARVIARLNVGGPARQAILLTKRLDPARFESRLVTGRVEPHEGDMTEDARREGVEPLILPGLGRNPSPLGDLSALFRLTRLFLDWRPAIVHTHTAKAGALGRIAAVLAGVPVRVHTFHGHVLHGYFGRFGSAVVRGAERFLALLTTRVVAVSEEVKDDLVRRHRIAPASRVDVVPLGLDLSGCLAAESHRGELRRELELPDGAALVGMIGRLTAVKEPALALEAMRRVIGRRPETRFVVAGGGDLADAARREADRLGLRERVRFLGWRRDLPRLLADLDLVLLTSRNEGTPVALIEAAAAGVPAVATRVGGVGSVVVDGETGLLAPPGDAAAIAAAVLDLLDDPECRRRMGRAARAHVRERFSGRRLVADLTRLYRRSRSG